MILTKRVNFDDFAPEHKKYIQSTLRVALIMGFIGGASLGYCVHLIYEAVVR